MQSKMQDVDLLRVNSRSSSFSDCKSNLSFAGCGFLGIYHVGVASCFKQYAPHLVAQKISGASAGALVACALITGCCLGECTTFTLKLALEARSRALGPLSPSFELVKNLHAALWNFLPENAHKIATGRLHISLTRLSDKKNILVSEFTDKNDLIDALICSSFVPLYSGIWPPKYRGVRYVDGALSDNVPILDEGTITVSPFAGQSDICPDDSSYHHQHVNLAGTSIQLTADNLYRMSVAFFPPSPETLSNMCRQGFDDALRFLQKNKLISCHEHVSFQSAVMSTTPLDYQLLDDRPLDEIQVDNTTELTTPSDDLAPESGVTDSVHDKIIATRSVRFADDLDELRTYPCEEHRDDMADDESECGSYCDLCEQRQRIALRDSPPPQVQTALQAAIDAVNKGFRAKLYKTKAYQVLSLMATPYFLPFEVAFTLAKKFYDWVPYMSDDMIWFVHQLYLLLRDLSKSVHGRTMIRDGSVGDGWDMHVGMQWAMHLAESKVCMVEMGVVQHQQTTPHSVNVNMGIHVNYNVYSPVQCVNEARCHLATEKQRKHSVGDRFPRPSPESNALRTIGESGASSRSEKKRCKSTSENRWRQNSRDEHRRKSVAESGRTRATDSRAKRRKSGVDSVFMFGTRGTAVKDETGSVDVPLESSGRKSVVTPSEAACNATYDTFDNCLEIANQMDAILAYYYLEEETRQVKVIEIFPLPRGTTPAGDHAKRTLC